jgi:hypothetical protein
MEKSELLYLEETIDMEANAGDKKMFIDGLKTNIERYYDSVSDDVKKEMDRIKGKYFGAGKTTTTKKPPTTKKTTPAKKTTPKPKMSTEEREAKKQGVIKSTGKSIEECKEILAKYEALRLKNNKDEQKRVSDLKDKDKIIDGTSTKTADATTESTAKTVAPKIKKEVEAIERTAENQAKKEVDTKGKTATEVKKEVKEVKEKIIEKEVESMTNDLTDATTKFVKSVQNEIAKFSKDEAKKFLVDLRKEIDILLRAYGYGGATQSYEIPWGGGGRPTMYAKGGSTSYKGGGEIGVGSIVANRNHKTIGIVRDFYKKDGDARTDADGMVSISDLELYNPQKHKGYHIAPSTKSEIESAEMTYKGGGEIISELKGERENNPKMGLTDVQINDLVADVIDEVGGGKPLSKALTDALKGEREVNPKMKMTDAQINDLVADINSGSTFKGGGRPSMYAKGGEITSAPEYHKVRNAEYDRQVKSGKIKDTDDNFERFDKMYFDELVEKGRINPNNYFAKGGKTRSTHSINQDRRRLSQEPWEQAYLPKRKGNFFAKGGKILGALSEDWGRDSDVYSAVHDSYVAYDSDEKAKEVLIEYDMLDDYKHIFDNDENEDDNLVDLFDDYENIPPNIQAILEKYEMEDNDYNTLGDLQEELEEQGYTFDFGLDATPYNLRKMYAKGGGVDSQKTSKYAVIDNDTDRIYVRGTDKDFIEKKYKELKEIYPNSNLIIQKFAKGGGVESKNDIVYLPSVGTYLNIKTRETSPYENFEYEDANMEN